jgi:hypothetical protein
MPIAGTCVGLLSNCGRCPPVAIWARPSVVRARINSRSKAANPPKTASMSRPCEVVASAHMSEGIAFVGDLRRPVQKVARRSRKAIKAQSRFPKSRRGF